MYCLASALLCAVTSLASPRRTQGPLLLGGISGTKVSPDTAACLHAPSCPHQPHLQRGWRVSRRHEDTREGRGSAMPTGLRDSGDLCCRGGPEPARARSARRRQQRAHAAAAQERCPGLGPAASGGDKLNKTGTNAAGMCHR